MTEPTTHTIHIRALALDHHHLTRAVYEQIPERDLITHDGHLDGTPWGTVNYHPGCDTPTGHLHIIHTQDDTLARATITLNPAWPPHRTPAGNLLYTACIAHHLHGHTPTHITGQTHTHQGVDCEFTPTPTAQSALNAYRDLTNARANLNEWTKQRIVGAEKRIPKLQATEAKEESAFTDALATLDTELADTPDLDTLYAAFVDEVTPEVERRQRHRDVRNHLADLPQLYILGGDQ